jgi:hypothetical protein
MKREVFQQFCGQTDPYEFWKAISLRYETLSETEIAKLFAKIYSFQLPQCKNMDDYINQKSDMRQKILAGGGKMKDRDLMTALLSGLSKEYSNFFDQLNAECLRDLNLFTAKLRSSARDKENLAGNAKSTPVTEKVYYVRTDQGNRGGNYQKKPPSNSKNKMCTLCHKPNHGEWECHNKYPRCAHCSQAGHADNKCTQRQNQQGGNRNNGQNKRKRQKNNNDGAVQAIMMIAAINDGNRGSQEWLIDSGATCHATFDRDDFIEFSEETRSIAAANGTKISVQGTGTVELKLGVRNLCGQRRGEH